MAEKKLNREDVQGLLRKAIGSDGVVSFSLRIGVTKTAVYDALSGARPPGREILKELRLKRIVTKTEAYVRETRRP